MKKTQYLSFIEFLGGIIGLVILSAMLASCDNNCLEGQGPIETQQINVEEFMAIRVSGNINVQVSQGETQSVTLRGNANIFPYVNRRVFNDEWNIALDDVDCSRDFVLDVVIVAPYVDSYIVDGSGDIDVEAFDSLNNLNFGIRGSGNIFSTGSFMVTNNTSIEVDGSGNVKLNVESKTVNAAIKGSGNIEIEGTTSLQDIEIKGSGEYYGFDLVSTIADVDIDGSGDCEVNVEEILNVNISGSGNVYYRGNPTVNKDVDGSGDVIPKP